MTNNRYYSSSHTRFSGESSPYSSSWLKLKYSQNIVHSQFTAKTLFSRYSVNNWNDDWRCLHVGDTIDNSGLSDIREYSNCFLICGMKGIIPDNATLPCKIPFTSHLFLISTPESLSFLSCVEENNGNPVTGGVWLHHNLSWGGTIRYSNLSSLSRKYGGA